jgi:hypothetical protein
VCVESIQSVRRCCGPQQHALDIFAWQDEMVHGQSSFLESCNRYTCFAPMLRHPSRTPCSPPSDLLSIGR